MYSARIKILGSTQVIMTKRKSDSRNSIEIKIDVQRQNQNLGEHAGHYDKVKIVLKKHVLMKIAV